MRFKTVKFEEIEHKINWSKAEPIIADDKLQAIKIGEFRLAPTKDSFWISQEVE